MKNQTYFQVSKAHQTSYPDPICFGVGVEVLVEREGDVEFPGWFWCTTPQHSGGWVHRSFLAATAGLTRSVRAYSAKELNVAGGERGTVIESLDGWAWVRLESGDEGWLPESHLAFSAARE